MYVVVYIVTSCIVIVACCGQHSQRSCQHVTQRFTWRSTTLLGNNITAVITTVHWNKKRISEKIGMFRSKLKVTKKSPRGAPSKAKKKKDISSYFVAPIPRQPSHPNFSQGSQSFQQFCSVSQSNTQQLHVSASMNNSAGDFVFRGNGDAKTNKRINFNDSQGGTRLFSSGSQAGGGNENVMPSLSGHWQ